MPAAQSLPVRKETDLLSPLVSTLIIVLFLFFIDEGYYDFRWMTDWGNWVVFGMYLVIFFPIQWLIAHFIFGRWTGWKKTAALVGISVPLTFILLWSIF